MSLAKYKDLSSTFKESLSESLRHWKMTLLSSVVKFSYNQIDPHIFMIDPPKSSLHSFSRRKSEVLWFQPDLAARFKPLAISMTLVGLEFVDVRKEPLSPTRWTLLWNYLILVLVSASLFHNICVQIFLFKQGEANSAFYTLFSIVKLVGSLLILAIFYIRKLSFCRIFADIRSQFEASSRLSLFSHNKLEPLQRCILIDCTISWLFLIMFIFTNIASNFGDDLNKYIHDYFFGIEIDASHDFLPIFLLSVETSVYFLATSAPSQFFALYYVLICQLITILFRTFNESLRLHSQRLSRIDFEFVRNMRCQHNNLTTMVSDIDEKLSVAAFIHYMILMADLSKYVYYLIDRLARRWDDRYEIIFVLIRVGQMIWLFVYVSFSASRVSEESVSSISRLQEISTQIRNNGNESSQLQLVGLLVKVYTSPSQLTGWNLFVINRAFVLTVLGVVITYSLVLFQITPWVQTRANSTDSYS